METTEHEATYNKHKKCNALPIPMGRPSSSMKASSSAAHRYEIVPSANLTKSNDASHTACVEFNPLVSNYCRVSRQVSDTRAAREGEGKPAWVGGVGGDESACHASDLLDPSSGCSRASSHDSAAFTV